MFLILYLHTGLSVVVSGTVNLDGAMKAAYSSLIPVFHDVMVSNAAAKVSTTVK